MRIEDIPEFELVDIYIGDAMVKQPHLRAVVEKGKTDAIAVVSDKYNLVQIRELFQNAYLSVTKQCENVEVYCVYYKGKGELSIFPEKSVGLFIQNSVDKSSAVRINFCTRVGDGVIRIPTEISPFVRVHTAKDIQVQVADYLYLLGEVKQAWEQIYQRLATVELSDDDIAALLKQVGSKRLQKYLNQEQKLAPIKFWDFIQHIFKAIHKRRYKTDFHRAKKIRRIGEIIITWAIYTKLGGNNVR